MYGCEIKIISLKSGEKLGANKIGEIFVRTPQQVNCYLSAKAIKNSFDEEMFFKIGDVGYYDENGFLYCTDRIKQIIKYCAQQVSPTDLQNILLQHESANKAAVVEIADDMCGELPKAFVVLKDEF